MYFKISCEGALMTFLIKYPIYIKELWNHSLLYFLLILLTWIKIRISLIRSCILIYQGFLRVLIMNFPILDFFNWDKLQIEITSSKYSIVYPEFHFNLLTSLCLRFKYLSFWYALILNLSWSILCYRNFRPIYFFIEIYDLLFRFTCHYFPSTVFNSGIKDFWLRNRN